MKLMRLGVLSLILLLFSSPLVTIVSAANNSSEAALDQLNDSMTKGDIRGITNASRNSSEELFSTFHNNSDALSALPGLNSMLGFIERLLQIMYDTADKIAGTMDKIESYLP